MLKLFQSWTNPFWNGNPNSSSLTPTTNSFFQVDTWDGQWQIEAEWSFLRKEKGSNEKGGVGIFGDLDFGG